MHNLKSILRSLRFLALTLGLALPLSQLLGQILVPEGGQFQINSFTEGSQRDSDISADGAGGFVVVWRSGTGGTDDSGFRIHSQRFGSNGLPIGGEFQVNSLTHGAQRYPKISRSGAEGYVVVWESWNSAGTDTLASSIQARRFGSDGVPLGDEFQVNTFTTDYQYRPVVSPDGAGGFVVVWETQLYETYLRSLQAQRFGSTGEPVGDEFQVNSDPNGRPNQWAVSPDGAGGFVVIWKAQFPEWEFKIRGQRYGSDGVSLNSEFQVDGGGSRVVNPAVAPDGLGGFVVVWSTDEHQDYRILGQRYGSQGETIGGEFQINENPEYWQSYAALSHNAAGDFLVVWTTSGFNGVDTSQSGITGRLLGPFNNPLGPQFQVNSYTTSIQHYPAVHADGAGGFITTWTSSGSVSNDQEDQSIQGQRFRIDNLGGGPFECSGEESLCLQGGRFEVSVDWRDFQNRVGRGRVVPGASDDSGLFWFFNSTNWEMLVKVLDGCALNDRYWVFAAATTDVEYNLVVRDSMTGETVSYHNDIGVASPAITDTNAFATCP